MAVKAGDIVRFLDSNGGGTVVRVDGRLAYVEDEDGFEVPVLTNECVVIKNEQPKSSGASQEEVVEEEEDYEFTEELGDDSSPQFYIAFLSGDKPGQASGNLRIQAINDSNYFVFYTISNLRKDGDLDLFYHGTVEPNTKVALDKLAVNQLDDRKWQINLTLFKKGKTYANLAPVSEVIKIKAPRFLKDNVFADNAYYHEKAVLMPVIKGEFERKLEALSDKEINKVIREKESQPKRKKYARRDEPALLEVDLHIDELIDTTAGLSKGEIINLQLDKFKQVMKDNEKNKGRKVVFIHGVGNGKLKTEVRKLLDRQYKKHVYQDASFQGYGYGATMVII
jgi:DNA-nicking Smr family endonuclease